MAEAKYFNNVIIGQFVLTGVPVKVYAGNRFLMITDPDDVESPIFGFGMDEDGDMIQFRYTDVEFLSVSGNKVDLETYNKGMADKFGGEDTKKEAPKEDDKESEEAPEEPKESIMPSIGDLMKEISQEEVDAEVEGAEAAIDAAKAKLKAAQAAMKSTVKKSKEKIKAAKSQPIDEGHMTPGGPMGASVPGYTFGTGDIVKNINSNCKHYGSIGVVKKIMDLPNGMGKVAVYTVGNSGPTYKPGMSLTKTIDQLEKYNG